MAVTNYASARLDGTVAEVLLGQVYDNGGATRTAHVFTDPALLRNLAADLLAVADELEAEQEAHAAVLRQGDEE